MASNVAALVCWVAAYGQLNAVLESVELGDFGALLRWWGDVGVWLPDECVGEGAWRKGESRLLCEVAELTLSMWAGLTCS